MRPFEAPDLRDRVLLFVAPVLLAGVLMITGTIPVTGQRAAFGAALGAAGLSLALFAPWRRLPATVQVAPPLLALVALAVVIGGDETPGTSPLVILVIGPVLWLALYHEPAQVWVGVAGAGFAVAVGGSLGELSTRTSVAGAALTVAGCAVVAIMTTRLLDAERSSAVATAEERDQHRLVLDHLPGTQVAHLDRDLRWVSVEGGSLPVPREQMIGQRYDDTEDASPGDPIRAAYVAALDGAETRLDHQSALTGRHYAVEVLPVRDAAGAVIGALSVSRDMTDERAAARQLAASERDHRLLTESARDMISRHDLDGTFLFVSAACRDLLGYGSDEMLGRSEEDLVTPEDHALMTRGRVRLMTLGYATIELRMVHRDGSVVWVEQRLRLVRDDAGEPFEVHSTARDVTARRDADRQLAHLATHDDLTGLWNRRRFNEALREELARAARRGPDAVMLLIDLDAFKAVNDTYGHTTGDEVLVAAADAIRSRMREGDAGGRLGGDEFAVLLRGTAPDQAEHVAKVYGQAIAAASVPVDGGTIHPQASVGWAVVTAHALDERSVLAGADAAMYGQKARRRESA